MTFFKLFNPIQKLLGDIPFHRNRQDILRSVYIDKGIYPDSRITIAVHEVNVEETKDHIIEEYTELHTHDTDEINVLLPAENHKLVYRMQIGSEVRHCEGPCTIYIPAGTHHKADVVFGKGQFLCIKLADNE